MVGKTRTSQIFGDIQFFCNIHYNEPTMKQKHKFRRISNIRFIEKTIDYYCFHSRYVVKIEEEEVKMIKRMNQYKEDYIILHPLFFWMTEKKEL